IGCDNQYLIRGGVTKRGVKLDPIEKITYSINPRIESDVPEWRDFLELNYDYPEWLDSRFQQPKIVTFLAQLYDKLKRKVEPCAIFNDLYINTYAPRVDPLSTET